MSCYKDQVLQNGVAGTAVGETLELMTPEEDYDELVVHVRGITTATVTFQANIDGTNWFDVAMHNLSSTDLTSAVTTATADGAFCLDASGLLQFRANITAHTTGTIYVTAMAS